MRTVPVMSLFFVVTCGLVLSAGCADKEYNVAKKEALGRWEGVRANMALQLAEQQYHKGQLEQARQTLGEAIDSQPADTRLYVLLARVLFEMRDLAAAEASLAQARSLAPELAEIDYLQGVLAQSASQWPRAHQAYLSAYQREPASQDYLCALAEAKLAMGQSRQASELLISRFQDFPSSSRLRIAAANSFLVMKDFDRAEQLYQEAIDIEPANTEAREGLANTFFLAGKYSQASLLLDDLTRSSTREQPALRRTLADCYLAAGQYSAAIRTYRECLQYDPVQPALQLNLARAWLLNGKSLKARQELQTLLQQHSTPEVWTLLGHTYLQDGEFDSAAKAYQAAMNHGGDQAELRFLLDLCRPPQRSSVAPQAGPAVPSPDDATVAGLAKE